MSTFLVRVFEGNDEPVEESPRNEDHVLDGGIERVDLRDPERGGIRTRIHDYVEDLPVHGLD